MRLSIIIPTYNRKKYLQNLINQLLSQNLPKNFFIDIVVVVDGSTDGTIDMLIKKYPLVHIVYGDGSWFYTKSMNEGFKFAQRFNPNYVLAMNDDIEIDDGYVNSLFEAYNKFNEETIIGSISYTQEKPHLIINSGVKKFIPWRLKAYPYISFLKEVEPYKITGLHKTYMLPGRGMLIPNQVLLDLNYFDNRFIQYHSDTDFCLRALKKNYKIYINWSSRLFTPGNQSSKTSSFIKSSLFSFIKSFFNPYSRRYIPSMTLFIMRHGSKTFFPITFLIFIAANFKAYVFNRKI